MLHFTERISPQQRIIESIGFNHKTALETIQEIVCASTLIIASLCWYTGLVYQHLQNYKTFDLIEKKETTVFSCFRHRGLSKWKREIKFFCRMTLRHLQFINHFFPHTLRLSLKGKYRSIIYIISKKNMIVLPPLVYLFKGGDCVAFDMDFFVFYFNFQ